MFPSNLDSFINYWDWFVICSGLPFAAVCALISGVVLSLLWSSVAAALCAALGCFVHWFGIALFSVSGLSLQLYGRVLVHLLGE